LAELGKHGYPIIDTEERAADYAGKLIIVEAALKKVKELLKGWCGERGPIDVGSGTYGFNLVKSKKIRDIEAFYEKLAERGLNPLDYMNVDLRKIGKLKKIEGFNELFEETGLTRFGYKRKK
jgi:hypothetical protein